MFVSPYVHMANTILRYIIPCFLHLLMNTGTVGSELIEWVRHCSITSYKFLVDYMNGDHAGQGNC